MDALMAALVLGALCQIGDRTPWLAAILADRYRARGVVIAAAVLALAANYALGALGGILIGPLLAPEAQGLLLGLALVLAGIGTSWRDKALDRLAGWRLGAVATSFLGLAIMVLGDRMQFIAAALAMRSPLPWLAAVGATLGALAVTVPAIVIGESRWIALPRRATGIAIGAALVLAGAFLMLRSIALI
ncbi:MAG: TMEM165/GDT1 family protein [Proteobacteria bacterium]|nr:TMEM165/GDT1 family protein [Pseudomonadota bacterium]